MHCVACDVLLTDFEATRKSEVTGEYVDLCSHCLSPIYPVLVDVRSRPDLEPIAETEVEEFEGESVRTLPRFYD